MSLRTIDYFKALNLKLKQENKDLKEIIEQQGEIICGLNSDIQKQREIIEDKDEQITFLKHFS